MKKEIIKHALESGSMSDAELLEFIDDYTYAKLDKHISGEELSGIVQLIKLNLFNLRFALLQAADMLKLNVLTISDKSGLILRTHVYESF